MRIYAVLMAAGALVAANAAVAGPSHIHLKKGEKRRPIMMANVSDNPFSDNFDSYAAGSGIAGQGGWQLWDPTSPNAWVDNSRFLSSPNSLRLDGGSDVVQLMNLTSGQWRLTADTYFPTSATTNGYLIALNTFPYTGLNSWSLETSFNALTGMVSDYGSPGTGTPAVRDQWVPIKVEVDLDTDTFNVWYNNIQIVTNRPWSSNVGAGGSVRIQCWDFYADGFGTGSLFYDNVVFAAMGSGCYPNCDNSTVAPILNVDDFTCFINSYASAQSLPPAQQLTHYANCDGSTVAPVLNVDDFTCFINAYAAGCP